MLSLAAYNWKDVSTPAAFMDLIEDVPPWLLNLDRTTTTSIGIESNHIRMNNVKILL